ncbi:hypothetical protein BD410DRAFT_809476 [Rickenella mellea]|uniref:Uncharacterized protein n=1 Tax=Rickenella mellea TaxID=50990 RepID=A0A4Y7PI82_9AGAM|nr:hypothetical protein BD410DRAFT_809476 [Rickenella mellea]
MPSLAPHISTVARRDVKQDMDVMALEVKAVSINCVLLYEGPNSDIAACIAGGEKFAGGIKSRGCAIVDKSACKLLGLPPEGAVIGSSRDKLVRRAGNDGYYELAAIAATTPEMTTPPPFGCTTRAECEGRAVEVSRSAKSRENIYVHEELNADVFDARSVYCERPVETSIANFEALRGYKAQLGTIVAKYYCCQLTDSEMTPDPSQDILVPLPHFIEQVRQRLGEPETPALIIERMYYEVAHAVKDVVCAPHVTEMIMHVVQGNTDMLLHLLVHLPELKKLAEEAEIHWGAKEAMEIDQPGLGLGESTDALTDALMVPNLVAPNLDSPVLPGNVDANVPDSTAAMAAILKEIKGVLQTNAAVDKRDRVAGIRARKARGEARKGRARNNAAFGVSQKDEVEVS